MAPEVEGIIRKPSGANIGFLLIHGFCADYDELASLGDELESRGVASFAVRLAGHGTTPEDLATKTWHDWIESAQAGLDVVHSWGVKQVFVAGLSMGAAIALHLSTIRDDIDGLILFSPALKVGGVLGKLVPLIKIFKKYREVDLSFIPRMYDLPRSKYAREPLSAIHELLKLTSCVRKELQYVNIPIIVVKAGADKTVAPENADMVFSQVASRVKRIITIKDAEHVITCHPTRKEAYPHIFEFLREIEVSQN